VNHPIGPNHGKRDARFVLKVSFNPGSSELSLSTLSVSLEGDRIGLSRSREDSEKAPVTCERSIRFWEGKGFEKK
jgi:hypothetical protein